MFLATEGLGLQSDNGLPTFFEMFMQGRINQSLKPALRHVITVLTERHPSAAAVLSEWFEEVFAAASLLIERQYLNTSDALFTESLYGFRRSKLVDAGKTMEPLSRNDRAKALALAVVLPYVKAKLDAGYERWKAMNGAAGPHPPQHRERLRRAFVAMYPLLHAAYESSFLAYQWAYMLGHTRHWSPVLHALRMVVRRITPQEAKAAAAASATTQPPATTTTSQQLLRYARIALVVGLVGYKVVEWWAVTPDARPRVAGKVVPPPPDLPQTIASGISLPRDSSICPLCRDPYVNPAVSSGGVAFCYRCLITHVRVQGACPVTLLPCREEEVRRLYLT